MTDGLLFVDFENISSIDLASVPSGVRVPFFLNAAQKSVPKELVTGAAKLGERFEAIEVEGYGKNALDFHIAFLNVIRAARDCASSSTGVRTRLPLRGLIAAPYAGRRQARRTRGECTELDVAAS